MAETEWGRLNAGQTYGILAVDVDRAIACANLREYEAIVFQHIREHSWGTSARRKKRGEPWPEATPIRPDFSALARELGISRPRLSEAKARLVRSKMLAEGPEGLTINKAAHEWVDPSDPTRPRLDPARLSYCARGWDHRPNTPKPPVFDPPPEAEITPQDGPENGPDEPHETGPKCTRNRTGGVRESVQGVYANPYTPVRESVQGCTPIRTGAFIKNARVLDPTGLDPTGLDPTPHAGGGAREGSDDRGSDPDPADKAERQAIRELADELTAGALGRWASDAMKIYEPHLVRALVESKLPGARPLPRIEWLNAILRRWTRGEGSDIPPAPSAEVPSAVPMRATGSGYGPPPRRPSAVEARQAAMDAIDGMDFGD